MTSFKMTQSEKLNAHKLPCKVYCSQCHAPLADEGRNMMLMMPTAMRFPDNKVPGMYFHLPLCLTQILILVRLNGADN